MNTRDTPDVILRPLVAADVEAILALWRAAGLEHKPAGRDRPEALAAQIAAAAGLFLGAEVEGVLVGTVLGSIDGRQKGWVNRLAVDPRYRRQGLAACLLAAVEETLLARGALLVTALIEVENAPSIGLFQASGYEQVPGILYLRKRLNPAV